MMSSSKDPSSLRLRKLRSFHRGEKFIYDIGCDHGLLGLSFMTDPCVEEIHLVDPSEAVIQNLKTKTKDSYISKALFIHQKPGQEIKIKTPSNCIFIAGMGGREITEIIEQLLPNLDSSSRIVISPHRNVLLMRERLRKLPLQMREETVVEENGLYYQILELVPASEGTRVSLFGGDGIWKGDLGESYLKHTLLHFKAHRDEISLRFIKYLEERK